jgi:hypothetical protein
VGVQQVGEFLDGVGLESLVEDGSERAQVQRQGSDPPRLPQLGGEAVDERPQAVQPLLCGHLDQQPVGGLACGREPGLGAARQEGIEPLELCQGRGAVPGGGQRLAGGCDLSLAGQGTGPRGGLPADRLQLRELGHQARQVQALVQHGSLEVPSFQPGATPGPGQAGHLRPVQGLHRGLGTLGPGDLTHAVDGGEGQGEGHAGVLDTQQDRSDRVGLESPGPRGAGLGGEGPAVLGQPVQRALDPDDQPMEHVRGLALDGLQPGVLSVGQGDLTLESERTRGILALQRPPGGAGHADLLLAGGGGAAILQLEGPGGSEGGRLGRGDA